MATTQAVSAKYQLVQIRLGGSLDAYLTNARNKGYSLRKIAADLTAVTGEHVGYETVRVWSMACAA